MEEKEKLIREVRELMVSRWTLGPTHGVGHWDRVYANGRQLLTENQWKWTENTP